MTRRLDCGERGVGADDRRCATLCRFGTGGALLVVAEDAGNEGELGVSDGRGLRINADHASPDFGVRAPASLLDFGDAHDVRGDGGDACRHDDFRRGSCLDLVVGALCGDVLRRRAGGEDRHGDRCEEEQFFHVRGYCLGPFSFFRRKMRLLLQPIDLLQRPIRF